MERAIILNDSVNKPESNSICWQFFKTVFHWSFLRRFHVTSLFYGLAILFSWATANIFCLKFHFSINSIIEIYIKTYSKVNKPWNKTKSFSLASKNDVGEPIFRSRFKTSLSITWNFIRFHEYVRPNYHYIGNLSTLAEV